MTKELEISKSLKSYLGTPITAKNGVIIGTLCAVDSIPFHFNENHISFIQSMADYIKTLMEFDEEILKREQAQKELHDHNKILTAIAQGSSLDGILDQICYTVEQLNQAVYCSILGSDPVANILTLLSAPTLSDTYKHLLRQVPIGPKQGSCGTAAYRKEHVIVTDIQHDPLWENYQELAVAEGLKSCWSFPIFASNHDVLGTFAIYYKEPTSPSNEEIERLSNFSALASIALEKKRDEEKIYFLAYHDDLTKLPNRLLLRNYFDSVMTDESLFIMILDLDEFKEINDTHGHSFGDELLIEVAQRLQDCVKDIGMVARLGGDEFAFIIRKDNQDSVQEIAKNIIGLVKEPVVFRGEELKVTASLGISMYPKHASTLSELKKYADQAMYKAKGHGKNQLAFFKES